MKERPLVRRFWASAVVVLLVAAGTVLAPGAAHAVQPKPPAVDAFPDLPRTLGRISVGHPNGPALGKPALRAPKWAQGKVAAAKAAAALPVKPLPVPDAPTVAKPGTPITAPSAFARGVGGATMFGAAFQGGFMLGAEGVKLYGDLTGADLDTAMCGADQWVQTVYGWISMGFGPSCSQPVLQPNVDSPAGFALLSYAGSTAKITGTISGVASGTPVIYYCVAVTGSQPAGTAFQQLLQGFGTTSHTWTHANWQTGTSSQCSSAGFTGRYNGFVLSVGGLRLIQPTTGETLAEGLATTGDPLRQAACTMTWPDASVTTGHIGDYRESEGFPMGGVDSACTEAFTSKPGAGPELLPSTIGIESVDTESGAKTEIATQEVPDFTESERKGLTAGNGTGLLLHKAVDGALQSCMTWEADCTQWWADTDEGTQTDLYRCTFGGQAVELAECGVYRYTFDTQTTTPTITDPATGESVQWSSSNSGQNSTAPNLGPTPGDVCFDEWSAAPNPVEWVLHPVKCALVWAFAPRPAVVEQAVMASNAAWAGTLPGQLPGLVEGMFETPNMVGCMGPHVFIPLSQFDIGWVDISFYPLAACEEPMSLVAATARLFGSAILIYMTALGIVRRGSATVNAPGLGGSG